MRRDAHLLTESDGTSRQRPSSDPTTSTVDVKLAALPSDVKSILIESLADILVTAYQQRFHDRFALKIDALQNLVLGE